MIKRLLLSLLILCGAPALIPQLAAPAHAAIAMLDAAETANPTACGGAGTCDLTSMTLSAGSNRKALCVVSAEDSTTAYDVNGITFGGVAMATVAGMQAQSPTDNNIVELWYLDEASLPSAGDHTVAVDFTEDVTIVSITCWTVSGIASGAPKDTDSTSTDTATATTTLTLTDIAASDWVFAAVTESAGVSTWSHGGSQTEIADTDFGSATTGISRAAGITDPNSTCSNCVNQRLAMVAAAWAEASTFVPIGGHIQFID